jgi:hypothetical protein
MDTLEKNIDPFSEKPKPHEKLENRELREEKEESKHKKYDSLN